MLTASSSLIHAMYFQKLILFNMVCCELPLHLSGMLQLDVCLSAYILMVNLNMPDVDQTLWLELYA